MNTKHPLIDPSNVWAEEDTDINCDIEDEWDLYNIEMVNCGHATIAMMDLIVKKKW